MEANDVRLMFTIIIEICERTFFLTQQQDTPEVGIFDEKIYQLPSFIESLAYMCKQLDENLPEGSLLILEKLVVLAIDSFPKLIKRYNYQISLAISHLFLTIQMGQSQLYNEFISKIVYQSLMRTFSYRTNYLMQQGQTDVSKNDSNINLVDASSVYNITCNDYIQFWSNLLNLCEFKELNTLGIHVNEKRKLTATIYDQIMETLIRIMKKLDLTAVKEDEVSKASGEVDPGASSDPANGLKAQKPRDLEILINLVDFSRYLLLNFYINNTGCFIKFV